MCDENTITMDPQVFLATGQAVQGMLTAAKEELENFKDDIYCDVGHEVGRQIRHIENEVANLRTEREALAAERMLIEELLDNLKDTLDSIREAAAKPRKRGKKRNTQAKI